MYCYLAAVASRAISAVAICSSASKLVHARAAGNLRCAAMLNRSASLAAHKRCSNGLPSYRPDCASATIFSAKWSSSCAALRCEAASNSAVYCASKGSLLPSDPLPASEPALSASSVTPCFAAAPVEAKPYKLRQMEARIFALALSAIWLSPLATVFSSSFIWVAVVA